LRVQESASGAKIPRADLRLDPKGMDRMATYLELSHRLSANTPLPLGVPPLEFHHHYNMERGDVSNLFVLHFSNHTGTHIDAPWHFVASGLRINDFRLEEFIFERPACIDLSLDDGGLVEVGHLAPHTSLIHQSDLLLLRTGYSRVRRKDSQRYAMQSPGVSSAAADHLVQNFPELRAIGLDTVSLACMQHLEDGLEAHRILLRGEGRRFLIIEDMNLDWDISHLQRVIALPLFIEGIDSSPCTVMGVIQ
jgi:arylformamidase